MGGILSVLKIAHDGMNNKTIEASDMEHIMCVKKIISLSIECLKMRHLSCFYFHSLDVPTKLCITNFMLIATRPTLLCDADVEFVWK